jgi:hypothetical protein
MPAGDNAAWSDVANTVYRPMVRLVQNAAQPLGHAVNAVLTFGAGSEELDTHGFHDTATNPSRVTPNVAGWYRCRAHLHMAATAGNLTQLGCGLQKNGARVAPQNVVRPDPSTAGSSAASEALISCNGTTDYIEAIVQQQNASAVSKDTSTAAPFVSTLEVVYERPL